MVQNLRYSHVCLPTVSFVAQKFHEPNQVYELLLDPLRRLPLTSSVRAKEARKAGFAKFDQNRKAMQTELEEENERIKKKGRKMRERRMEALRKQAEVEENAAGSPTEDVDETPLLGHLDTIVKIDRLLISSHPNLTTRVAYSKAPTKSPKSGIALVPFRQVRDALLLYVLVDIERGEGRDPPILGWLKRKGTLATQIPTSDEQERNPSSPKTGKTEALLANLSKSSKLPLFSSFPESFIYMSASSKATPAATGLDYESLTLMRLRRAEHERPELEI
ncbi:hypothetical protein ACEPAI_9634 [Sanghuangporus weigelae]